MKVVAINGSPRKNGNTQFAFDVIKEQIEKAGHEFEVIHVGNKTIRGCASCYHCVKNKTGVCIIKDDIVNESLPKLEEADAIILGSPTYFGGMAGQMKAFLDRAFFTGAFGSPKNIFRGKIGAGVVAVRRSGGMAVFNSLNSYFYEVEMTIPGSTYWNIIHGLQPGEAAQDAEGIQTMRILGKNIAYLLKQKEDGVLSYPESEEKELMSFIR